MQEYINFPLNEYNNYQKRLQENKPIYTTRVSNEVNKYKLGLIYKSDFGNLQVISLNHYNQLKNHPFYNELTKAQIKEINKYIKENGYDVIDLTKV